MDVVTINGLRIAYEESGHGPVVLLLHGWPTSSYLWRDVAPAIAARHRVIAVDLPGFGESDKPLDRRYSFGFFGTVIDGLLEELGIGEVALAVHDLGGPIGVHWALRNPGRLTALALLNTLLYPELDPSAIEFVTTLSTPGRRETLTSPEGLADLFRAGLADPTRATDDVLAALVKPFPDAAAREALAHAGIGLELRGLAEIAQALPELRVPVLLLYGEQDRLLPDVAQTMGRVQRDLPHAVTTRLPHCGHFLQEDAPHEVGRRLAEFFASAVVASA